MGPSNPRMYLPFRTKKNPYSDLVGNTLVHTGPEHMNRTAYNILSLDSFLDT